MKMSLYREIFVILLLKRKKISYCCSRIFVRENIKGDLMNKIHIVAELRDFGTKAHPVIKGAVDDDYHFVYIFKANNKYIGAHPLKADTYGAILVFDSRPKIPKEDELNKVMYGLGLAISYGAIDVPIPEDDKTEIKLLTTLNEKGHEFQVIEILKRSIELEIESNIKS